MIPKIIYYLLFCISYSLLTLSPSLSSVKFATLAAICAKNGMKFNKADMPEPVDDDDSAPSTLRYATALMCDSCNICSETLLLIALCHVLNLT